MFQNAVHVTRWFVHPESGLTSEVIGREVGDENTHHAVPCSDGTRRDLYEVSPYFLKKLREHGKPLRFSVWCSNDGESPHPFTQKARHQRTPDPEVRKMFRALLKLHREREIRARGIHLG